MKIICIGRNYVNHAKELGNEVPTEPVIFIKPSTAINVADVFHLPVYSQNVHYELELVLKINKTIKNVSVKEASQYYNEIALGIDFTARDLQTKLKAKGLPWEKAKAFDNSAFISSFIPLNQLKSSKEIAFSLYKNDKLVQKGNSAQMLFSFDELIAAASQYFTLEKGDLIFTGTPEGVGSITTEDTLKGKLEDVLSFELKIQ